MQRASELKRFGLTLGGLLALAGAGFWLAEKPAGHWLLASGILLAVCGVVRPLWLGPLETAMIRLGHLLGRVTTPIILSLLFVLVLVPTALLARLVGKRFMPVRGEAGCDSYWEPRVKDQDSAAWRRQF